MQLGYFDPTTFEIRGLELIGISALFVVRTTVCACPLCVLSLAFFGGCIEFPRAFNKWGGGILNGVGFNVGLF